MILINLLPPELRKKDRHSDPVVIGLVAAVAASLIPVGLWAWIHYGRLPNAERVLGEEKVVLEQRTTEANAVEKERAQIKQFEVHRDMVVGLLARKVFWARTLDEFIDHLVGPGWQGFEICCTDLQIAPIAAGAAGRAAKAAGDLEQFSFKGKFRLIGDQNDKSGDIINSFFRRTEASDFWIRNGFVGKPEKSYRGDKPEWRKEIERVSVEMTLEWVRAKKVVTAAAKVGK